MSRSSQKEYQKVLLALACLNDNQRRLILRYAAMGNPSTLLADVNDFQQEFGVPSTLGILDKAFIADAKDAADFAKGLFTIQLHSLKVPKDAEWYQAVLAQTFGISQEYATQISKRIETPDKITGIWANAKDFFRRAANTAGLGMFYIDQSQEFDYDQSYEIMLLGREIGELAKRVKFGSISLSAAGTQSALDAGIESGDSEELGDSDEFGDIMVAATPIPYSEAEMGFPGMLTLASLGAKAASAIAAKVGKKDDASPGFLSRAAAKAKSKLQGKGKGASRRTARSSRKVGNKLDNAVESEEMPVVSREAGRITVDVPLA